jgi:hypothetical protein
MLRTEADVVRTLAGNTVTVERLYTACRTAGVSTRDGGHDPIPTHGRDQRFKRRARGALQALKRAGHAHRVAAGTWIIDGTAEQPWRALLVVLPGELGQAELVLGEAADILAGADEPLDLVLADPPWALRRGHPDAAYRRTYERDHRRVLAGYVEVASDPATYGRFTSRWVLAAARALRPGGYLVAVTGPQQAARLQVVAEDVAELTYVNTIVARRAFPLRTTRRLAFAHWTLTVLTRGPLHSRARYYACPDDLPRARSGREYGQDVWTDMPRHGRPGQVRWDNSLPGLLVNRVIRAFTRPRELVADPFVGSGTSLLEALRLGRRFYGGDVAPQALQLAMARVVDEQPTTRVATPVEPETPA